MLPCWSHGGQMLCAWEATTNNGWKIHTCLSPLLKLAACGAAKIFRRVLWSEGLPGQQGHQARRGCWGQENPFCSGHGWRVHEARKTCCLRAGVVHESFASLVSKPLKPLRDGCRRSAADQHRPLRQHPVPRFIVDIHDGEPSSYNRHLHCPDYSKRSHLNSM